MNRAPGKKLMGLYAQLKMWKILKGHSSGTRVSSPETNSIPNKHSSGLDRWLNKPKYFTVIIEEASIMQPKIVA